MMQQLKGLFARDTIPIINIHGNINSSMTDKVAKRLASIRPKNSLALAVSINSRGGLPVQGDLISKKIRYFANNNNLKVYTFAQDLAASAGYWILSMGDEVYCDHTSIVGNIGVLLPKYNAQGLMERLSLEYKTFSTNDNMLTNVLSPMKDLTPEERAYVEAITQGFHEKFKDKVRENRGDKLKEDVDPLLFEGEIYMGQKAKDIGLVDSVGSMIEVLNAKYPTARLDAPKRRFL